MNFPIMPESRRLERLRPPRGTVDIVLDTDTYNEIDDQFAVLKVMRRHVCVAVAQKICLAIMQQFSERGVVIAVQEGDPLLCQSESSHPPVECLPGLQDSPP